MFYILTDNRIEPYHPKNLTRTVRAVSPVIEADMGGSLGEVSIDPDLPKQSSSEIPIPLPSRKKIMGAYDEQLEELAPRHPLTVEAIMTHPAETLRDEMSVEDAIKNLNLKGFKHYPVVGSEGEILGIVSDRDLISSNKKRVSEVMSKRVVIVDPKANLRQLVSIMLNEKIPSVPVVSSTKQILGIVTTTDILRTFLTHTPLEIWS